MTEYRSGDVTVREFDDRYVIDIGTCASGFVKGCCDPQALADLIASQQPKPRTERVPILEALGRISAESQSERFEKIYKSASGPLWIVTDADTGVEVYFDGMVEVLIEDET